MRVGLGKLQIRNRRQKDRQTLRQRAKGQYLFTYWVDSVLLMEEEKEAL